jgi:hypothetical protein
LSQSAHIGCTVYQKVGFIAYAKQLVSCYIVELGVIKTRCQKATSISLLETSADSFHTGSQIADEPPSASEEPVPVTMLPDYCLKLMQISLADMVLASRSHDAAMSLFSDSDELADEDEHLVNSPLNISVDLYIDVHGPEHFACQLPSSHDDRDVVNARVIQKSVKCTGSRCGA